MLFLWLFSASIPFHSLNLILAVSLPARHAAGLWPSSSLELHQPHPIDDPIHDGCHTNYLPHSAKEKRDKSIQWNNSKTEMMNHVIENWENVTFNAPLPTTTTSNHHELRWGKCSPSFYISSRLAYLWFLQLHCSLAFHATVGISRPYLNQKTSLSVPSC